jgi:orotate phosphoribosyltransferase-like protein
MCVSATENEMSVYAYPVSYSAVGMSADAFRTKVRQISEDLPVFMKAVNADTVVVSGSSGLSVAFALRMLVDIPIIMLRKDGEGSHSGKWSAVSDRVITTRRYVILDDFTESGETVNRIIEDMKDADLAGLFFYARGSARMFVRGVCSNKWGVPRAEGVYGTEHPAWRPLNLARVLEDIG